MTVYVQHSRRGLNPFNLVIFPKRQHPFWYYHRKWSLKLTYEVKKYFHFTYIGITREGKQNVPVGCLASSSFERIEHGARGPGLCGVSRPPPTPAGWTLSEAPRQPSEALPLAPLGQLVERKRPDLEGQVTSERKPRSVYRHGRSEAGAGDVELCTGGRSCPKCAFIMVQWRCPGGACRDRGPLLPAGALRGVGRRGGWELQAVHGLWPKSQYLQDMHVTPWAPAACLQVQRVAALHQRSGLWHAIGFLASSFQLTSPVPGAKMPIFHPCVHLNIFLLLSTFLPQNVCLIHQVTLGGRSQGMIFFLAGVTEDSPCSLDTLCDSTRYKSFFSWSGSKC